MTPVRLEPAALRSRVKHSTTEPLRSHREYLARPSIGKKLGVKLLIFSCPSVSAFVLGAQKNRFIETILVSNHNIRFG